MNTKDSLRLLLEIQKMKAELNELAVGEEMKALDIMTFSIGKKQYQLSFYIDRRK